MNALPSLRTGDLSAAQPENKKGESMELTEFKDLVDRHYPMLYRFALGLGCTKAYASDLTQQSLSSWA
jgi:DNA-directed RNA polymerase specialized sigma24 family protein